MTAALGIDYGGTHTKLLLAVLDPTRPREVRREMIMTPRGRRSLAALAEHVRDFVGDHRLDAFGVTVAGVLDEPRGQVRTSTNMPWLNGVRPAAELASVLGAPGRAVHDGAAAATAEALLGAGRGHSDVFVLALGTGVAGAHVVDGVVRRGAHGAAGELGHVVFGGDRPCSCGQRGCLESEIGGAQLAARWKDENSAIGDVTAKDLVEAARRSDPRAVRILDEATTFLARGILGVISLVDPETIVVGGGLAAAADLILDPTIAKVRESATFHHVPPITGAELGRWGGAWGGVLAAQDVLLGSAEVGAA